MLLYLLGSSANTNPIYPIEDETRAYSLSYSFGRRLRLVSASSASVHDLLDHELEYISHGVVPYPLLLLITCPLI